MHEFLATKEAAPILGLALSRATVKTLDQSIAAMELKKKLVDTVYKFRVVGKDPNGNELGAFEAVSETPQVVRLETATFNYLKEAVEAALAAGLGFGLAEGVYAASTALKDAKKVEETK